MKPKVIKALFSLCIATTFTSLCVTFAWFTGVRLQQVQNSTISMTGLTGKLYYYNGNAITVGNTTEWCGYPEGENQSGGFTEVNISDPKTNPFQMRSARPGSRYLFYFEAKLQDTIQYNKDSSGNNTTPIPVEIQLRVENWLCETNDGTFPTFIENNQTTDITLARAIHMYAGEVTNNAGATNNDKVLAWANDTVSHGIPSWYADNNKFKQTTASKLVDAKVDPIFSYEVTDNNFHIIPFILEFTNDPATCFTTTYGNPDAQGNVEKTYVLGGTNPTSNVYMGMKFTIKELALTHIKKTTVQ